MGLRGVADWGDVMRLPFLPGGPVPPDYVLGTVVARGGERTVTAPWPAEIIEWLVEEGDPVSEGQPLVRVQPEGARGMEG